jgi:hypothetical protein
MDVDFGLLGLLLAVAVAALFLAAFVIGVVLRWLADLRRTRAQRRRFTRPAQKTIERARR